VPAEFHESDVPARKCQDVYNPQLQIMAHVGEELLVLQLFQQSWSLWRTRQSYSDGAICVAMMINYCLFIDIFANYHCEHVKSI
jgi:hypothetical protein